MKLFFTSKRVLRSFKFLTYILDLSKILKNKNFILFVMHNTQSPTDRIFLNQSLAEKDINASVLPKKISNFFFKEKKYIGLKNLLSGNIMLVKNNLNETIKKNTLQFIFQQDYFCCHILL